MARWSHQSAPMVLWQWPTKVLFPAVSTPRPSTRPKLESCIGLIVADKPMIDSVKYEF